MAKKRVNKEVSYVPMKYFDPQWQTPAPFGATGSNFFYTLLGFVVLAGFLVAIYRWFFWPRYHFLVPKKPAQMVVLPSPESLDNFRETEELLPTVSTDDDLNVLQAELEETSLPDFNDELERIKMMIERL
jgi:hypothetical protein